MCGGLPSNSSERVCGCGVLESGSRGVGLLVVVYQYTRKKFAKIPEIHPSIPKINGNIVYCIPEIQRK